MRAFKTIPYCSVSATKLSKGALGRLVWIDWYFAHGRKARATMRHFNLSPTVFYRWMRRYKKYDLRSIEDNTSFVNHLNVSQKVILPVKEFVSDGLDHTLGTTIHLGSMRVGKVVNDTRLLAGFVEV